MRTSARIRTYFDTWAAYGTGLERAKGSPVGHAAVILAAFFPSPSFFLRISHRASNPKHRI